MCTWEMSTTSTPSQHLAVDGMMAPQVGEARRERRVGEEAHAADVDEHGRMAQPADIELGVLDHQAERRFHVADRDAECAASVNGVENRA